MFRKPDPHSRIADALEELVKLYRAAADTRIGQKLDTIITMLGQGKERDIKMALDLSRLETEVSENKTVIGSAVTLLGGLKTELDRLIAEMATPEDKAKLQAFADTLDTETNALADAVAANTPVA